MEPVYDVHLGTGLYIQMAVKTCISSISVVMTVINYQLSLVVGIHYRKGKLSLLSMSVMAIECL